LVQDRSEEYLTKRTRYVEHPERYKDKNYFTKNRKGLTNTTNILDISHGIEHLYDEIDPNSYEESFSKDRTHRLISQKAKSKLFGQED
jgi:deoxyadenosine/deoxycytidine kinase